MRVCVNLVIYNTYIYEISNNQIDTIYEKKQIETVCNYDFCAYCMMLLQLLMQE